MIVGRQTADHHHEGPVADGVYTQQCGGLVERRHLVAQRKVGAIDDLQQRIDDGRVAGDRIEGTFITRGPQNLVQEGKWSAERQKP